MPAELKTMVISALDAVETLRRVSFFAVLPHEELKSSPAIVWSGAS